MYDVKEEEYKLLKKWYEEYHIEEILPENLPYCSRLFAFNQDRARIEIVEERHKGTPVSPLDDLPIAVIIGNKRIEITDENYTNFFEREIDWYTTFVVWRPLYNITYIKKVKRYWYKISDLLELIEKDCC